MRIAMIIVCFTTMVFTVVPLSSQSFGNDLDPFYAYYTKRHFDDPYEKIVGQYTDIVVNVFENNQVVFSRQTSYLPVWQTRQGTWAFEELIPRQGDGDSGRPDRINRYSHVRLIKNEPDQVIVHWRYVENFKQAEQAGFIDEYFTFTPDKKVRRRVRFANDKLDEWQDLEKTIRQECQLNESGIEILLTKRPEFRNLKIKPVTDRAIKNVSNHKPVLSFHFDEGIKTRSYEAKDMTLESVHHLKAKIDGNISLYKEGVSGSALMFDGYSSGVKISNKSFPKDLYEEFEEGFTISAWISIGAYSWNWSPIIHQSQWSDKGYFLGINDSGQLGFMAKVGDHWETVRSKMSLERFRWYHVAASYNLEEGLMCIFLDGKLIKCQRVKAEIDPEVDEVHVDFAKQQDFLIGMGNNPVRATNAHRRWTYPATFGFDGLIDEVALFNRPLSWQDIKQIYDQLKPSRDEIHHPDMDRRHFPANPEGKTAPAFSTQYWKLDFYENWDNLWRVSEHPDVLVEFEQVPGRFAFWRGLSYGIGIITDNGKWSGDQSCETWGDDIARGCCEHMSDKQCRHSHVRIIENTPARSVIHWRYGEVDVRYIFPMHNGDGPFADEYWTFYPDGFGIRHVARGEGGWQETMFYNEPGTRPEDNVDLKAFTSIDSKGKRVDFDWTDYYPYPGQGIPATVTMVNMKSTYKPVYIYPPDSQVITFVPPLVRRDYSAFHWANHYPVSQMSSDGRSAEAADRSAHSSLVWGEPSKEYLMVGLSNQSPEKLLPRARSWNNPPRVIHLNNCKSLGYEPQQRCYQIENNSEPFSFTLDANHKSPLVNPAFEVKNWPGRNVKATVMINGKTLKDGQDFQQGVVFNTEGKTELIIWLKLETYKSINVEIGRH